MATNREIFDQVSAYLQAMDLGGLFSIGGDNAPGGWLWEQITSGVDSEAAIQISLEATQEFQTRYGVITAIRQQAASGAPVHVPTVAEVREYEQRVSTMMRQVGLPAYMYDSFHDAQALMVNGLSAVEVEQRLGQAWDRVQNTDPAVRQVFSEFYGTLAGDAALAATFLDPARTMANIEKQSRAAYTAGMGRRVGLELDQSAAERIAGLPKTEAGIYQDLTAVSQMQGGGIFSETMGERAKDLTAEQTGIDATVFGDGIAQADIEKRVIERRAQNAAVPGGALRTNRGMTGLS